MIFQPFYCHCNNFKLFLVEIVLTNLRSTWKFDQFVNNENQNFQEHSKELKNEDFMNFRQQIESKSRLWRQDMSTKIREATVKFV